MDETWLKTYQYALVLSKYVSDILKFATREILYLCFRPCKKMDLYFKTSLQHAAVYRL